MPEHLRNRPRGIKALARAKGVEGLGQSVTEILKGSRLHCLAHQAIRAVVRRRDLRIWNFNQGGAAPLHFAKETAVRSYARRYGPRVFVETGTYMGDMAHAVRDQFDRILTIELDTSFCRAARWRLRKLAHVTVLEGDSKSILPEILESLYEPSLFWLDAHYSGWPTAKSDVDTPILDELDVVLSHGVAGHVILIDDARCFIGSNDYPTIAELREFVVSRRPEMTLEVSDDIIRIHPPG